jgi:hypothetical protein
VAPVVRARHEVPEHLSLLAVLSAMARQSYEANLFYTTHISKHNLDAAQTLRPNGRQTDLRNG